MIKLSQSTIYHISKNKNFSTDTSPFVQVFINFQMLNDYALKWQIFLMPEINTSFKKMMYIF